MTREGSVTIAVSSAQVRDSHPEILGVRQGQPNTAFVGQPHPTVRRVVSPVRQAPTYQGAGCGSGTVRFKSKGEAR